MAEAKHPIRNSVIASLITATITAIAVQFVPGGWPWVFGKAKQVFGAVATWLGSPATLPTWLVLTLGVLSACVIVAVVILAVVACRSSKAESSAFTEADFFGVKWRWRYGSSGIYGIASFCPVCDLQVHPQDGSSFRAIDATVFRCDDGHWESERFDCTYEELEDRVRRKIQQKLRNGAEAPERKKA